MINDNEKDKKEKSNKEGIDRTSFKKAIGMIESSGGKYLDSKYSSAAGKYHFLYNLIKDDPDMRGISKRAFMNNPDLQEKIMDKAIDGKLKGYVGYDQYSKKLKSEFNTELSTTEIAALTHFLGAGGVRSYLKDPKKYNVEGKVNATPEAYVEKFRKSGGAQSNNDDVAQTDKSISMPPMNPRVERAMQVPRDRTNISDSTGMKFLENRNIDMSRISKALSSSGETGIIPIEEQIQGGTPSGAEVPGIVEEQKSAETMGNPLAMGGQIGGPIDPSQPQVIEFKEGGTHAENIHGGIPIGMGANGKMNTVEEGETKFGDYVFSNRFGMGGKIGGAKALANMFAEGGDVDPVDPNKKNMTPKEVTKTFYRGLTPSTKTDVIEPFSQMPMFNEDFKSYVTDDTNSAAYRQKNQFIDWYSSDATRDKALNNHSVGRNLLNDGIVRGAMTNIVQAKSFDDKNNAVSDPETRTITMQDKNQDNIANHEISHASNLDALFGDKLGQILGNPWMSSKNRDKDNPDKATGNKDQKNYLKSDHEAYGNFHEFRLELGLKPGENLSPKELKKRVKEKGLENNMFYKNFDDEKISQAIREVASNNNQTEIKEYRLA